MKLGIVGHEAAKFTSQTEQVARACIRRLLDQEQVNIVVSGKCHLGGIDIWAVEEARIAQLLVKEFPPKTLRWSGGYKERNMQIAEYSDKLVCIVVKELPEDYEGMRFSHCYHCGTDTHVKSGGCWTMRYAKELGMPTELIVI